MLHALRSQKAGYYWRLTIFMGNLLIMTQQTIFPRAALSLKLNEIISSK